MLNAAPNIFLCPEMKNIRILFFNWAQGFIEVLYIYIDGNYYLFTFVKNYFNLHKLLLMGVAESTALNTMHFGFRCHQDPTSEIYVTPPSPKNASQELLLNIIKQILSL